MNKKLIKGLIIICLIFSLLVNLFEYSISRDGCIGDIADIATTLFFSKLLAMASKKELSTPPENATIREPKSFIMEANFSFFSFIFNLCQTLLYFGGVWCD